MAAQSETLRVASFNASLSRSAPGLLLKDLLAEAHPQIDAVAEIIQRTAPDILLINEFDHDLMGEALAAFQARLRRPSGAVMGIDYPHTFSAPVNTGEPSGFDLNGDGSSIGPEDAFGFGRFPGQYGMAILSRHPIDRAGIRSFRKILWERLDWADLPLREDGSPFPSAGARRAMRLSSKSHWDVPVLVAGRRLSLLALHPTPPVFDGPEDANGRRNHDEIMLFDRYTTGEALVEDRGATVRLRPHPFVLLGDLNADPLDGDGRHGAVVGLLARLGDPRPASEGGAEASRLQGGSNAEHRGDPAFDTADFREEGGPGNLRVDYVLPGPGLRATGAGVFWPTSDDPLHRLIGAGRPVSSDHRLVWVDLAWD